MSLKCEGVTGSASRRGAVRLATGEGVLASVFALHRLHDGNAYLLFEAAGKPLGVLFVQALPLESRINPMLDCLPKPRAFSDCQNDVVNVPKLTDHAVEPVRRSHHPARPVVVSPPS